jgi:hypothetical protein
MKKGENTVYFVLLICKICCYYNLRKMFGDKKNDL